MSKFEKKGSEIRELCKSVVLEFMASEPTCKPTGPGMKQSQIFKSCGLDWGTYPAATSTNQQYWIVAILSKLEKEGKVERVSASGPWRLK